MSGVHSALNKAWIEVSRHEDKVHRANCLIYRVIHEYKNLDDDKRMELLKEAKNMLDEVSHGPQAQD